MAVSDVAFPFRIDETGLPALAEDDQVSIGMIRLAVGTLPGEIEGWDEYGEDVWRVVFEHALPGAASLVHASFADVVERWLPFLRIVSVRPEVDETEITLNVVYERSGQYGAFGLVYPKAVA